MGVKAFLFDRDGIVNVRKIGGYIETVGEFVFHEEFFEIFRVIGNYGYLKIIITNQQGVGKGLMSEQSLREIHARMQSVLLDKTGFQFDEIYYCSDLSSSNSLRRKPASGMIEEAVRDFDIDASCSWMLGDSPSDVQAGKSAGCKTILIGDFAPDFPNADLVFPSLQVFSEKLTSILE
jgi:histidinol-phosphate phosphatase family protein